MAGPTLYCTVADVLALVSLDAQARLATDPGVPALVARADGFSSVYDTPFYGATTITALVASVPTTVTLIPGGAADGNDQIQFASPPALDAIITAKADLNAVNTVVVQQCITLATNKIKGSLARYDAENPGAAMLAVVQPIAVFFTRWFLRIRRTMNEWDPILEEYRANNAWLMAVAKGQIALPSTTPIVTAPAPSPSQVLSEQPPVFDPPGAATSGFLMDP